ncbi:hypothetical protein [uncultured Campylobacter sp.]|uniref:hypothetical protein n=1 Tax=uncultured Campylobacter sp. TaxID=218934 RepID=UPI002609FFF6|nr:hypothetical protein [uncultured Campylobacter sp.]
MRFSLLAAGNLTGYAAVYLKNDGYTRLQRQIYAKIYGQTAALAAWIGKILISDGWLNFMAELRGEF